MSSLDSPEPWRGHRLRSDTTVLLGVGFALFAGGIALVVAPEYSQWARGLADALARFAGIQSGVLVLGGLVFFSLGIFSRRITRLNGAGRMTSTRPEREDTADVSFAVEQLAGDVAEMQSTVQQVSSDVSKTSETLERLLEAQETLVRLQGQARDQGEGQQPVDNDPLFLLASSLDQMNAQLDARLSALMARVDGRPANPSDLPEAEEEDPGGSAPDATGVEPLQVLVRLEDDPEDGR